MGEDAWSEADLPVKVYDGEPADIVFLRSLLEAAGIEIAGGGAFFGAGREVYVRKADEMAAREILADFESSTRDGGNLLPGRWPK